MTHQERDRLSIAVGFSLVVHVIVAVLSGVFGTPPDRPDYLPPLRVELASPERVEPEPVIPTPEPEPVPPEPTPLPEQTAPTARPAPEARAPGASAPGAAGSGEPQAGADPLAGRERREFSLEELMRGEEATTPAPRSRSGSEDVLQADPDSLAPDVAPPGWAGTVLSQAGVSSDQMSDSEAIGLAERIESSPEFQRLLSEAIAGLDRPAAEPAPGAAGPDPGATSGAEPGTDTTGTADGTPGDPRLVWEGGDRGEAGPLPELTAADFGGRVPDETRFVVIFQVDSSGGVVPGSIIFQQRSLYTQANSKIERAISSWRFDSAPGAGTQSAVFTLVVRREDDQ